MKIYSYNEVRRLTDIHNCPEDFRSYPQNWKRKEENEQENQNETDKAGKV